MSDQPYPQHDPDDDDLDDQDITRHRDYGDEDPEPLTAYALGWRAQWPTPDDFWQ